MKFTRTWIDTKLSRRERGRLVEYLLERWANPTAEQILDALGELFPDRELPSIRSVSDWKAKSWQFEADLAEMREEETAAKRIVETDNDFGSANKKKLDELLFRKLRELKSGDEIDGKLHDLVLSSARLTAQDRANRESARKAKLLEAQLAEYKRREAEWQRREAEREEAKKAAIEAVSADKGYTKQQREKVVQQFKLL